MVLLTMSRVRCLTNLIHGGTKAFAGVLVLVLGAAPPVTSAHEPPAATTGSITGVVSYPSEVLPPMRVYTLEVSGAAHYETATGQGPSHFTIDGVPRGTYYVVAYTQEAPRLSGGWSRAVTCGLKTTCTDHALIPVTVVAGKPVTGVRVADWYAPSGTFPAEPAAAAPAPTETGGSNRSTSGISPSRRRERSG